MNNKKPLILAIAAVLAGNLVACSSNNNATPEPTAFGTDPITGLVLNDPSLSNPQTGNNTITSDNTIVPDTIVPDTNVPDTTMPNGAAMLSQSNYEAVVEEVFAVYTGAAYGGDVLALPPYPGLSELSSGGDFNDGSTARTDSCENGGSADISLNWSGSRVIINDRNAAFDNCQHQSLVLNGEVQVLQADNISVASSGLTIEGDGKIKTFSGGAGYGDGNNYGGSSERWWGASDLNWSISTGDQVDFAVSNANANYQIDGGFGQNMSGGFTLTNDGYTVQVQAEEALQSGARDFSDPNYNRDNWFFTSGTLRITATDGSSILIETANGEDASARVTLAHNGAVESFDKPWSDWDSVLKAGPSPTR